MKKFLASLWNLFCVPAMVMLTGIAAVLLFKLLPLLGLECGTMVRFVISLILLVISMMFLANKPRRTLVISSLIACGLCLFFQLLGLAAMRVAAVEAVYSYLITYTAVPFHISLPVTADNMQNLYLNLLALLITTFVPMLYCFCPVMRRKEKTQRSGAGE